MILVKFVARTGVLSRRKSEEAIRSKKIRVNGIIVSDPTHEVGEHDVVLYLNKRISIKSFSYILLNKPLNYLTSKADPSGMPFVMELLPYHLHTVDPVGRLDFNTSGALLLTDDGELAYRLSHPKFEIRKVYAVTASRPIDETVIENLKKGVYLEDGMVQADHIIWNKNNPEKLIIGLHGGKYRVIRRTLEQLFIFVKKLHRLNFGSLDVKNLQPGEWRYLLPREIKELRSLGEKKKVIKKESIKHTKK
jgi:23S rRNA pseudouridine2605 synthase